MPAVQLRWEDIAPTLIKKQPTAARRQPGTEHLQYSRLGSGSAGIVFEAYYHGAPIAVKVMTVNAETGRSLLCGPVVHDCTGWLLQT